MPNIISDNMREFMKQEDRDREGTAARVKYLVENPTVIDGLCTGALVAVSAGSSADSPAMRWARDHHNIVDGLRTGRLTIAKPVGLPVSYDQSLGLRALIERAVGPNNLGNINPDITQERFKLEGTGLREVKCWVEPYLDRETREQAAKRLTGAGHNLRDTGDLAGFLHDHPEEVEKWGWVDAISEDSRWTVSDGNVCVPFVLVIGARRGFCLAYFRDPRRSGCGVLVGE